jgi:hypothetical protein
MMMVIYTLLFNPIYSWYASTSRKGGIVGRNRTQASFRVIGPRNILLHDLVA